MNLITGFLSLYLAFTNFLAASLIELWPDLAAPSASPLTFEQTDHNSQKIKQLNSRYQVGGDIPDILIKNAAYQNQTAALSNSIYPAATAKPEEAIVNIFCTFRTDQYEKTTTGTGYFIHPDGIIITNAHVAQTLLLANIVGGDSKCEVRTGSPATPTYTAELLYISPAWLREHARILKEERPRGTGERDYALLYVNSALNNKPMPRVFPALSFDTDLLRTSIINQPVRAAGYPADSLVKEGPRTDLIAKAASTTITELMTFGSNYADIFSIAGSVVGQGGASGGPVVNQAGQAIGVIVTRGDDELFGNGSLRALTVSYIDRTMREETGFGLLDNIRGNLPYRAELYRTTMVPFLEKVMRWELAE